jgi:glycosyltransferase involved in cell wall biosynthesis
MTGPSPYPLVSIIVTSYNYAPFLRDAVDSALAQDYQHTEVIVVDDGSTDASRQILAAYRGRVHLHFKENGGQSSSVNAGYRACRGELIMTLDADDVLEPNAVSSVVRAWTPDLIEVHFPLKLINQDGSLRPGLTPSARIASGDIASILLQNGRYIGPPSSGNVYSRTVLDAIMPIPEETWSHSDAYLETLTPFYGRVLALDEPLARYRIHSSNFSGVTGVDRLKMLIHHDRLQDELLTGYCLKHNLPFQSGAGLSHWGHLKLLLALDRAVNSPTLAQASREFVRSVWRSQGELNLIKKIGLTIWAWATALLPGRSGKALMWLAFSRPQFLRL